MTQSNLVNLADFLADYEIISKEEATDLFKKSIKVSVLCEDIETRQPYPKTITNINKFDKYCDLVHYIVNTEDYTIIRCPKCNTPTDIKYQERLVPTQINTPYDELPEGYVIRDDNDSGMLIWGYCDHCKQLFELSSKQMDKL